jgi:hypothetical protein
LRPEESRFPGERLAPAGVHAQDREVALFDKPLASETVPPGTGAHPTGEITCTWYRDFMVRETDTDTPGPGAAMRIPVSAAAGRPACGAAPPAEAIQLTKGDYSLLGRMGPFLLFAATDPNGAVPFHVLAADDGRRLYSDGMDVTVGLRAVTLEQGALRLRFLRGFNGSCSIVRDGAGCWAKMAREGMIGPALAASPPPVQVCVAAYRKADPPATADDPSLITYEVDMTLDLSGSTRLLSRGPVGCEPMP